MVTYLYHFLTIEIELSSIKILSTNFIQFAYFKVQYFKKYNYGVAIFNIFVFSVYWKIPLNSKYIITII